MRGRALLAGVAAGLVARAAIGQATPRDAAAAEALFESGRADVARGEYPSACPKFAESQRLDPAPGTLINLADCEEHIGQLARSWEHWREALERLDSGDPRRPAVAEHRDAVDRRLPRLTLKLAQGVERSAVSAQKDGVELGAAAFDVPLPIDPGEHAIAVTAPGRAPATFGVTIAEGARETLIVAPGAALPEPAPAAPEKPAPRPAAPSVWPAYALFGLGVAGIAVGSATGIAAISKKHEQESNCFPANVCNATGADAASAGRALAIVSTVSFAVGAAAAASGVVYLLVARKHVVTPVAFAHGAGVAFGGAL